MNGWILTPGKPIPELDRAKDEAAKHGFNIDFIDPDRIDLFLDSQPAETMWLDADPVPRPDFAVSAFIGNVSYHNIAVLRGLEAAGVLCVNRAQVLETTRDKLRTLQALGAEGLPVPKTMLLNAPVSPKFVIDRLGLPVVMKVLAGSKGSGVVLVESERELDNLIQMYESAGWKEHVLLQECISASKGRDLRVLVIDKTPVVGMERMSHDPDGFKSNFSAGGSVKAYDLSPAIQELARKIIDSVGLDIGGIDLLFNGNDFSICEVNSMPGFQGIESCCDINVPMRILTSIARRLAET